MLRDLNRIEPDKIYIDVVAFSNRQYIASSHRYEINVTTAKTVCCCQYRLAVNEQYSKREQ